MPGDLGYHMTLYHCSFECFGPAIVVDYVHFFLRSSSFYDVQDLRFYQSRKVALIPMIRVQYGYGYW